MKTQTQEDKKCSLNNLLKINLLSIHRDKSRQKPQLKMFDNTDITNTFGRPFDNIKKPSLTTTSFYNPYKKQNRDIYSNKSNKNKTMYSGRIPLEFMGKATLDCSKTFYTSANEELKKNKKLYTVVKNKVFNPFDNEIMSIDKKAELKFKTEIKLAQNSSGWYKLKKYKNLISELRQREYEGLFTKMLKLLDVLNLVFVANDKKERNFLTPIRTITDGNKKNNSKEEEENYIPEKMKKLISAGLEIGSVINKFANLVLNELREKTEENSKLVQKCNEQEMQCNHVSKELEKLQKFCENYDITSKMYLAKARENTINNIKNLFHKKENEFKINMYKMEDEIKDLTYLLNKNKDYFLKYKEKEEEVIASKKQRDEYKYLYNKEIHEKILLNASEKDKEEELNKKVNELEDIIDELKEEIELNKRKEIESNAKLSKIMMILREKNENLLMFNEELEWYIREYNKKKNELKVLENRVFKNNNENSKQMNEKTEKKKEQKVEQKVEQKNEKEKVEKKDEDDKSKLIKKEEDNDNIKKLNLS